MATQLDSAYLLSEFGYDIAEQLPVDNTKISTVIHNLVYKKMIAYVIKNNVDLYTTAKFEEWLAQDGGWFNDSDIYYTESYNRVYMTSIEKIDWWKQALAYQTIQIVENGDYDMMAIDKAMVNTKTKEILKDVLKVFKRTATLR